MRKKLQALGRMKSGIMNRTEAEYDALLRIRQHAGEVVWYRFEGIKFKLANNCFYTPDFAVMLSTGELEAHEVKGFWTDDARVKIKCAAEMYPIRFVAKRKATHREGGGWVTEEFE